VQTAIETAATEHSRNEALFFEEKASTLKVAPEVEHGHYSCGHDLGIAHLRLLVFVVMQSLEHIVTQTKHCYNLAVHGSSTVDRFADPSTLAEKPWTFLLISFHSLQGGNLGYYKKIRP
jgi:hypothetical protein